MTDKSAYKVLTADEWAALNAGTFQGAPINLSTASQLTETVDRHFSGQQGLIIAAIDLATLGVVPDASHNTISDTNEYIALLRGTTEVPPTPPPHSILPTLRICRHFHGATPIEVAT